MFRSRDGISLVFFQTDVLPAQLLTADDPQGLRFLSQDETKRLNRYRSRDKQIEFLSSRLQGRLILSEWTGCEVEDISWSASGPPEIRIQGVRLSTSVSLSHSHGVGVWVLSESHGQIGVDLEAFQPQGCCGWARTFMTKQEQQWVEQADSWKKEIRLLNCWTVKEAAYKCLWKQRPCEPGEMFVAQRDNDADGCFEVSVPTLEKKLNAKVMTIDPRELFGWSWRYDPLNNPRFGGFESYCCAISWDTGKNCSQEKSSLPIRERIETWSQKESEGLFTLAPLHLKNCVLGSC